MSNRFKDIIDQYRAKGISIEVKDGNLAVKKKAGSLTEEQKEFLRKNKEEIIRELTAQENSGKMALNAIQSAYFLGRMGGFEYGGLSCQVYFEVIYDDLDKDRANEAFRAIIRKHEMLRAVIGSDAKQEILEDVPEYEVTYNELPDESLDDIREFGKIRKNYAEWSSTIGRWPFFNFGITKLKDSSVLHLVMDFMIADWTSIWIILKEFEQVYFHNIELENKEPVSFREYLRLEEEFKSTSAYRQDMKYWQDRIDDISPAPSLPILKDEPESRFERKVYHLDISGWNKLKESARKYNCTPTVAVITAYAMTLAKWAGNDRFGLNLTMLNRMPLIEGVEKIVGDFTSVSLLETCVSFEDKLADNMKRIQVQMSSDLDHSSYSGVSVMRDITRQRGKDAALYPFVFTGSIGLVGDGDMKGRITGYGISQTPQVFIDCQAMDHQDGLDVNWDIRKGVFLPEVEDSMFAYFGRLMDELASDRSWDRIIDDDIPSEQRRVRDLVNETTKELPYKALNEGVRDAAEKFADSLAIRDGKGELTYGQFWERVLRLSRVLKDKGIKKADKAGILLPKGREQIIAALAILNLGAVYVPLDEKQPENRINLIIGKTGMRYIISDEVLPTEGLEADIIRFDESESADMFAEEEICSPDASDLAYIIFTSGSTGLPKGVEISHGAACNTIVDVNDRFNISNGDRAFAISRLNFDLSVYDIFGLLSVGGAVIIPDADRYLDAKHWAELLDKYRVTVWNSVPAIYKMLLDELVQKTNETLRIVLLSGDWIPVNFRSISSDRCVNAQLIGLGGATEASIWSNFHIITEADDSRVSIPYGRPLSNQAYRVVDSHMKDRPDHVTGEICILGKGVAEGYCNEPDLTKAQFMIDENGQRLYRTGDYGYYESDGTLIFCGRRDNQIKLHGHRIETGEIEKILQDHSDVEECKVLLNPTDGSNLIAVYKAERELDKQSLTEHMEENLPEYMLPAYYIYVEEFPLSANGKKDTKKIADMIRLELSRAREETDEQDEDVTGFEKRLIEIFEQHIGVSGLKVRSNVYDHGADSLVLARIISDVRDALNEKEGRELLSFDALLRQILNRPTVRQLYDFIKEAENKEDTETKKEEVRSGNLGMFTLKGEDIEGPARIIFHAGLGTMNCFRYLIPELEAQRLGPVYGVTIQDMDLYCSKDPEGLIAELGKEYAKTIADMGIKEVQLIGYCMGGLIAHEAARELTMTDVEIKDFLLVDSAPVFYDIGESIALELIFITNYFITVEDVYPEITNKELIDAITYVFETSGERLHEEDFELLKGAPDLIHAYEFLKKMAEIPMDERFETYVKTIAEKTGGDIPKEMLAANYHLYIHSFKASRVDADPYFGDVRFLQAKEPLDFIFTDPEDTKAYWNERIVGDITWEQIPGNHVTCIEDPDNAKVVASYAERI